MLVCQWHLEIPFSKQSDAVPVRTPGGRATLAPSIIPGSQRRVVYRVLA